MRIDVPCDCYTEGCSCGNPDDAMRTGYAQGWNECTASFWASKLQEVVGFAGEDILSGDAVSISSATGMVMRFRRETE